MAKKDLGEIAERLFGDFLAPLVLGGDMRPGRPIGGRAALALGVERTVVDVERLSLVELQRVRVGRRLAPIDRLEPPDVHEWALGACLHDVVQSTHPDLAGMLRAKAPGKLLEMVLATLGRIPNARTSFEALSRHTWFSRLFEIARTDTHVSWWTGSQTFLGRAPPPRLAAWPELRRVRVEKTPRMFAELCEPALGARVPRDLFYASLRELLARTPLTDLATSTRAEPTFLWTKEGLALLATRSGRTLVNRALKPLGEAAVSDAMGRATELLLAPGGLGPSAAHIALDLLGDLALAAAENALGARESLPNAGNGAPAFARATGALVARASLAQAGAFTHETREGLLAALAPWLAGDAAQRARAWIDGASALSPSAPPS